jgi:two-component system, cell cycle sensor histidine kinase and response regulator CckA
MLRTKISALPMEQNSHPSTARGAETILLVEDEPSVRRLVSQMLQLTGYTVLEAANGPEALGLMDHVGQPVDLLLTDVVMPPMNGGTLAQRLSRRHPKMRVLFTSGYMDDVVVQEIVAMGAQFLPKPFTPDALTQKVRQVLDEPWYGLLLRDASTLED